MIDRFKNKDYNNITKIFRNVSDSLQKE